MKKQSTSSFKKSGKKQENPYIDLNSAYDKLKRGEFETNEKPKKKVNPVQSVPISKSKEKASLKEKKAKKTADLKTPPKKKEVKKESKPIELFKSEPKNERSSPIVERKVEKKNRLNFGQIRITALLLSGILLLFSMATLLIGRYSEIAKMQYEINKMNGELADKQTQIEELKVKLESQSGSEMIERYARENLGMEYPKEDKITYIRVN